MTLKFKKKHHPICHRRTRESSLPGSTTPVRAAEMLPQPWCEPLDVLTSFFASSGLAYMLCTQWAHSSQLLTSLTTVDRRFAQRMRPQREGVSCRQNLHICLGQPCQASLSHSPPLIFITKSYAASATPGLFQIL